MLPNFGQIWIKNTTVLYWPNAVKLSTFLILLGSDPSGLTKQFRPQIISKQNKITEVLTFEWIARYKLKITEYS